MQMPYQTCPSCGSINLSSAKTCQACGSPLDGPPGPHSTLPGAEALPQKTFEQERRQREQIQKALNLAGDTYFWFWHTAAQVFAIALTGFALGVIGGATDAAWVGLVGALLVGLAVGWARKWSIIELLSAPLGLVLGTGLGILFWFWLHQDIIFVIAASLGSAGLALLGSSQAPFPQRSLWQKLRPLFGLLGGMAFGLLGLLVGVGLRAGVLALLK